MVSNYFIVGLISYAAKGGKKWIDVFFGGMAAGRFTTAQ